MPLLFSRIIRQVVADPEAVLDNEDGADTEEDATESFHDDAEYQGVLHGEVVRVDLTPGIAQTWHDDDGFRGFEVCTKPCFVVFLELESVDDDSNDVRTSGITQQVSEHDL